MWDQTRQGPINILEAMASLVDKNLMCLEDVAGQPRFRMLETIRAYGREQLEASGEATLARLMHATFFLSLAERARPSIGGPDEKMWLDRLESEHANLRAALEWFVKQGEAHEAMRLAEVLLPFWR